MTRLGAIRSNANGIAPVRALWKAAMLVLRHVTFDGVAKGVMESTGQKARGAIVIFSSLERVSDV